MRLPGAAVRLLAAVSVWGSAHASSPVPPPEVPWPAYPEPATSADRAAHHALIGLRSSYGECLDAAAGTTAKCVAREFSYQSARLDRVHQKWMLLLREPGRAELQREQRHWIAYRNAICEGEKTRSDAERCRVVATADRAAELEERLKQRRDPPRASPTER